MAKCNRTTVAIGTRLATAAGLGLAIAVLLPSRAVHAENFDFTLLHDGAPIGEHHVTVRPCDDSLCVITDIAIDVKWASLHLFDYRQHSEEVWKDDRLQRLISDTDDNGATHHLVVVATADGELDVSGTDGHHRVPGDIVPTSYWTPRLLTQRQLLSSEDGRLLHVAVTPNGTQRYHLAGDLTFDIDYQQGRWVGLHLVYLGQDVEYVPLDPVPAPTVTADNGR